MISWLKSLTFGLLFTFVLIVLAVYFARVAANDLHATHAVMMSTLTEAMFSFTGGILIFGVTLGRWIGQTESVDCGRCGGSGGLTFCQIMRRLLVGVCFVCAIWQGMVATNLADGHKAHPHLLGAFGFLIAGMGTMLFDYWWEHRDDYDEELEWVDTAYQGDHDAND